MVFFGKGLTMSCELMVRASLNKMRCYTYADVLWFCQSRHPSTEGLVAHRASAWRSHACDFANAQASQGTPLRKKIHQPHVEVNVMSASLHSTLFVKASTECSQPRKLLQQNRVCVLGLARGGSDGFSNSNNVIHLSGPTRFVDHLLACHYDRSDHCDVGLAKRLFLSTRQQVCRDGQIEITTACEQHKKGGGTRYTCRTEGTVTSC